MDDIFTAGLSELQNFISTDFALYVTAILGIALTFIAYTFIVSFFTQTKTNDNDFDEDEGY